MSFGHTLPWGNITLPEASGPVFHPQAASGSMLAGSFPDGTHEFWKAGSLSDLRDALPLMGTNDFGVFGPEKRPCDKELSSQKGP